MARRKRSLQGGTPYHVLNRGVKRQTLFRKSEDYDAFLGIWREGLILEPLPLLAYCLMPNHWHAVVWPPVDDGEQVSRFLQWVTMTHAQRHHLHYETAGTGHVYQGRFKSFPIQSDRHLYDVIRYVERNPLRAGLVDRAEDWRWSSLWQRTEGDETQGLPLTPWPVPCPSDLSEWVAYVNQPRNEAEESAIRDCVRRGAPYGSSAWVEATVEQWGLQHTVRGPGRPRKRDR